GRAVRDTHRREDTYPRLFGESNSRRVISGDRYWSRPPWEGKPRGGDAPGIAWIRGTLDRRTGSGPLYRTAGHGTGMDFGRENLECASPLRELPVPLRVRGHAGIDPFGEIVRALPEPLPHRPDAFGVDRGFVGGTVHLLH